MARCIIGQLQNMQNPWSVWFRFDPTVGLWVGVSSGARHDVKQTQAGSRGRKRDHSLATCAYVNKWGVNLSTCLLCTTCVIYDWLSTCVAWFSYVSDYGFLFFEMQHCWSERKNCRKKKHKGLRFKHMLDRLIRLAWEAKRDMKALFQAYAWYVVFGLKDGNGKEKETKSIVTGMPFLPILSNL